MRIARGSSGPGMCNIAFDPYQVRCRCNTYIPANTRQSTGRASIAASLSKGPDYQFKHAELSTAEVWMRQHVEA